MQDTLSRGKPMFSDPLKLLPLVVYIGGFTALITHAVTFEQFGIIVGAGAAAHTVISAVNNVNPK